jgi:hypothetical protein
MYLFVKFKKKDSMFQHFASLIQDKGCLKFFIAEKFQTARLNDNR